MNYDNFDFPKKSRLRARRRQLKQNVIRRAKKIAKYFGWNVDWAAHHVDNLDHGKRRDHISKRKLEGQTIQEKKFLEKVND